MAEEGQDIPVSIEDILSATNRTGVPEIEDLKTKGPVEKRTEIGQIKFDTFTVKHGRQSHFTYQGEPVGGTDEDESSPTTQHSFGVYGMSPEELLIYPPAAIKAVLDEMFIQPNFEELTLEEFIEEVGSYEVEVCVQYLFMFSGMLRTATDDVEVDLKNDGTFDLSWS